MAENVIPAVVGEVVSTAATFIKNKFDKLSKLSEKVEALEWELLKIKSAVEESKKYDIDNEPLREMQQKYIDIAKKGDDVLRIFKNQSTGQDNPQSSVQGAVMPPNSTNISLVWKMLTYGLMGLHFLMHPHHFVGEYVDSVITYAVFIDFIGQVDRMSHDVGKFLEMVRQQKRKRERRRRYRPYKLFFTLILHYCQLQASRMRLFQGMSSPVYQESKLKCAGAVPKVLTDVVSFSLSHKSLLLV